MKLANTGSDVQVHAPCRSFLFDICKRDYSSQEVSAINLKYSSVASSHNFIHCRWNGSCREADPGPKTGEVTTRLNQREIYLQRGSILDHQKQRRMGSKSGMTKIESKLFEQFRSFNDRRGTETAGKYRRVSVERAGREVRLETKPHRK